MIVCIPAIDKKGLASAVCAHFGKAPFHYIINTENNAIQLEPKPTGEHGHCLLVRTLLKHQVEMVLCDGIGRGAVLKFTRAGIAVMRTEAKTVEDALNDIKNNRLAEVREEDCCPGHGDHDHIFY